MANKGNVVFFVFLVVENMVWCNNIDRPVSISINDEDNYDNFSDFIAVILYFTW